MQTILLPAHYLRNRKPSGLPVVRIIKDLYHKEVSMEGKFGLGGEAMCEVIDARTEKPVPFMFGGKMVMQTPWVHNMITNWGMNAFGEEGIVFVSGISTWEASKQAFARNIIGSGSSADKTESGAVTASQSGDTVTLSGAIGALESERVIKWDSGESSFILSGGGTSWTASSSKSVSSGPFTIFHTNRTTADTGIKNSLADNNSFSRTNNVSEGWSQFTNVWTHEIETGNQNYNELCWTYRGNTSVGSNITNRIILPASVTVLEGQQLRVTLRVRANFSPISPTASSVSVLGWDIGSATEQLLLINSLIVNSGTDGLSNQGGLNPNAGVSNGARHIGLHTSSSLPAFNSSISGTSNTNPANGTTTNSAYVTNSFTRETVRSFSASQGNVSGIRGFVVNDTMACLFENPVNKLDTHTLSITFRRNWERAYV